jgi:nitroreductase
MDSWDAGRRARMRLEERYRAADLSAPTWNDVLDTMLAHRSVRTYRDAPLQRGVLETIVAAAQSAPSSSNLQAWSVIAVRDRDRKARLSRLAAGQRHVAQAPVLLVFVADLSRVRTVSAASGRAAEGLDYIESFIIAVADAAFAAQNALTAAESLGLGGCYIGAMRNDAQAVARELDLPDDAFAVFGMTLGYPDAGVAAQVKPRLPQQLVLHHEQYRRAAADDFTAYDDRLRGFRSDQQMAEIDWTDQAARRLADKKALTGRESLRPFLLRRGFGLQ